MDRSEIVKFGNTFRQFMEQMYEVGSVAPEGTRLVVDAVAEFFGADPVAMPVVTDAFKSFEHATIQVALEALLARPGTRHELLGVAGNGREDASWSELLSASRRRGQFWVGAIDYVAVPVSVDEEINCVRFGAYLIDDGSHRVAVLLRAGAPEFDRPATVEVLAASAEEARDWLGVLAAERSARNLLRRQVLSFEHSDFEPGAGPVRFHRRPDVERTDVILSDALLDRVDRQVVGVARHRERLLAEGRHLKRGVLLYGPPGTGKTHTVRYLVATLREFTVVLLAGPAIRFVSEACAMARQLQPALIVLEDCDLVAEDRSYGGSSPLLFTVLDEMDGLAADADVCFLLTTNRVDVMETALVQRPGRVDLAVEVPLPDADARRRLLALYGRGIRFADADLDAVVEATEGVPASFVKELTRRATLLAAEQAAPVTEGRHVYAAAQELLASQEHLTRRLLGSAGDAEPGDEEFGETRPGPGGETESGHQVAVFGGRSWFSYVPRPGRSHRTWD